MADSRVMGAVLLIAGTSIGAGMLALPVTNAAAGFVDSSIFLVLCWLFMTFAAFLILEVNLWLPPGSNLISMAKATLGPLGEALAWFTYLFLLYALLSAYISGGTDVFKSLLQLIGISLPARVVAPLFVLIFGVIVVMGMQAVDWVNRILMFGKLFVFALLTFLLTPHIELAKLIGGELRYITGALMVLITSFGFATIVPSLRSYLDDDIKKLRTVILAGSVIPLVCYMLWDAMIMGIVPRLGTNGLVAMTHSGHATTDLTHALQVYLNSPWVTDFFRFFTSICMLTAFLAVSFCLTEFLADGLHLKKSGRQAVWIYGLTFIPPLIIMMFYPNAFIMGLSYAGVFCVVLLALLPLMMAYSGRYYKQMNQNASYQVMGGRVLILVNIFIALVLMVIGIIFGGG